MHTILQALRPQQWIKNTFALAALLFSRHLFDLDFLWRGGLAFVCFCAISSAVYLFNDILDRETDRLHPEKCRRPIASGSLAVSTAAVTAGLLAAVALIGAFFTHPHFALAILLYALLNIAYSMHFKHVVILDVMFVSAGFLVRAIGGALAIQVAISSWFILCTLLLALFLGFVKRRQELLLLEARAGSHRRILAEYSPPFLDQAIAVVTAGSLVSYALYTLSPEVAVKLGTPYLHFTIPFVVYGLLRYLYLVYNKGQGGNPASTVLGDLPILLACALWLLTLGAVLYW